MDKLHRIQDKIRGSLIGGAAGDALGYPIEFFKEFRIFDKYGSSGITAYETDPATGLAHISDDTQMTLFTATALIYGRGRQVSRGVSADPRIYGLYSYLVWLRTQQERYCKDTPIPPDHSGWAAYALWHVPELYARRAPGHTCLSALAHRKEQLAREVYIHDFIADTINNSKGCGGIMRVAPLGLAISFWDMPRLDMEGAQLAAITHSHPLGYMPAAVLTHILNRLVQCDGQPDLKAIILEAKDAVSQLFAGNPYLEEQNALIDLSITLSENNDSDQDNIRQLGEGWVAEEALAIPLYCCLKYPTDFSKALIASVNHRGDSDSTGAITGNIMGALLGYRNIDPKWTEKLELRDLILQLSDDLFRAFYQ